MNAPFRCLIMGAAGRDFHNFQTFFRERPEFLVCAFTAAQIPFIEQRSFPRSLAGANYQADIPIYSEERLADLIRELRIDWVFLAYSDLSHDEVMHKASVVAAAGASFGLLGPRHTELSCDQPVVAITASRTGAGKSPLSQWLAERWRAQGKRVGVLRHPMPYGNLERQAVERLATRDDLTRFECTVEEREEYEPYIDRGLVIFAGVDYARVLAAAVAESERILWDGGNNDFSFIRPTVSLCVVDPLRARHVESYYPGEANVRMADLIVINKVRSASFETLAELKRTLTRLNPAAVQIESDLPVEIERPERLAGKRVLVVEDGPTLTHGGMGYGAGLLAARQAGVEALVDPRPAAVGSIAETFREFPHLTQVLPALGYSETQRRELAETIERSGAEVVLDGSPCRLERLLSLSIPVVRVAYRFEQVSGPPLLEWLELELARRRDSQREKGA